MPKRPTLAIVILAYNEQDYLPICLDAIAAQTKPPDEVIVVNNNSTDDSALVAGRYGFVRVINEAEQGMIPARNAGFNATTCDLIARIDADTKVAPDWVETVHRLLDSHTDEIYGASGPAYVYGVPGDRLGKLWGDFVLRQGYFRGSKLMLGHETLFGSNMIITRKAWQKVRDEVCHDSHEVHEDVDLALHIGQYGRIAFEDSLIAGVSRRGFIEGPRKVFWRLRVWPKTVTYHRKLFQNLTKQLKNRD